MGAAVATERRAEGGNRKTLGQIAQEAAIRPGTWDRLPDSLKEMWERAADAVVKQVMERVDPGAVNVRDKVSA